MDSTRQEVGQPHMAVGLPQLHINFCGSHGAGGSSCRVHAGRERGYGEFAVLEDRSGEDMPNIDSRATACRATVRRVVREMPIVEAEVGTLTLLFAHRLHSTVWRRTLCRIATDDSSSRLARCSRGSSSVQSLVQRSQR